MDYYATVDGFTISHGEVLRTDAGEFLRVKVERGKEEFSEGLVPLSFLNKGTNNFSDSEINGLENFIFNNRKLMVDRETFDYSKMNVTIVDADHPLPGHLDCEEDSYYDKYDS